MRIKNKNYLLNEKDKPKLLKEKEQPLVSIITVVYNGENYLEQTIKSVINQTFKNLEYVIIDGGSNDSTIDIVKKYENYISYWISEPDNGIYHAMNKGIKNSSGEYIAFLNSSDLIYRDTILKFFLALRENKYDYTVGPVDIISESGLFLEKFSVLNNFYSQNRFFYRMASSHMGFFINRKFLNKIGLFDENFKLSADYEMTIRAIKSSKNYFEFIDCVGSFRLGGKSNYLTYIENFKVMKKHKIPLIKNIIITIKSLFKFILLKYLRETNIFRYFFKIYINYFGNK